MPTPPLCDHPDHEARLRLPMMLPDLCFGAEQGVEERGPQLYCWRVREVLT